MREPWRWRAVKKRQVGSGETQLMWRGTDPPAVVRKADRISDSAYADYFRLWQENGFVSDQFVDAAYHRAWQAIQNYRRIALKNGAILF